MNIPENSLQNFLAVENQCLKLIDLGIWDIKKANFQGWLSQFRQDEDKFFASKILEKLVYRNNQQFDACMRSMFRSGLNGNFQTSSDDLSLLENLVASKKSDIRVIPVINDDDPPTKSGPLVLRRLKKSLKINERIMIWPWQLTENLATTPTISKVIFVDDFLGSGSQFCNFFSKWNFDKELEKLEFFYVSAVAHEIGINNINSKFPRIKVVYSEKLDGDSNFFSDGNWLDCGVSSGDAKDWYEKFLAINEIDLNIGIYGYENMGLTFGFSHSTPNNSLPILWYKNHKSDWKPLLER